MYEANGLNRKFAVISALIVILGSLSWLSCGSRSQKPRTGYYIAETSRGDTDSGVTAPVPRIYYFFDRTESMRGFVAEDYSAYSTVIPQIWNVSESTKLWAQAAGDASFFEFGEGDIRKLRRQYVRDNIQKKSFYGSPHEGQIVYSNNGIQVFETVAKYIATQTGENNLFVAVTDLYEQNREDNCFSILFSDAFKSGLSGALIAVESRFNGSIENISINTSKRITVDGQSTFFIFIVGQRNTVKKYCEALLETVEFKQVQSEYILFLTGNDFRPAAKIPLTPDIKNANSDRTFERIAYNNNINLKKGIAHLFVDSSGTKADSEKEASFRLIGNTRSQYVGGVALDYADTAAFTYEPVFTVAYANAKRPEQGKLTVFEKLDDSKKKKFSFTVVDGVEVKGMDENRYPLAVVIGTENHALDKGCYQIQYEVFQKANVPQWIMERSAANLNELEDSIKPNSPVKILRLESIYRYIAQAYNFQSEWGKIYTDSLYLEKTR